MSASSLSQVTFFSWNFIMISPSFFLWENSFQTQSSSASNFLDLTSGTMVSATARSKWPFPPPSLEPYCVMWASEAGFGSGLKHNFFLKYNFCMYYFEIISMAHWTSFSKEQKTDTMHFPSVVHFFLPSSSSFSPPPLPCLQPKYKVPLHIHFQKEIPKRVISSYVLPRSRLWIPVWLNSVRWRNFIAQCLLNGNNLVNANCLL